MSTAIVSFGRASKEAPIFDGNDVRTELVTFTTTHGITANEAEGKDNAVNILTDADAWAQVSASPVADEPGTLTDAVWPVQSGTPLQLRIERGHKVSVVAR
jgi:hypothetical protein